MPIKVAVNGQVVASLDDDFFDPGYGVMGLYNPSKFLEHTQGYFFGLEPLDEEKTQLLFVHGVTGTPRDWKFLVDGIDRSRFQPWFFYYPVRAAARSNRRDPGTVDRASRDQPELQARAPGRGRAQHGRAGRSLGAATAVGAARAVVPQDVHFAVDSLRRTRRREEPG